MKTFLFKIIKSIKSRDILLLIIFVLGIALTYFRQEYLDEKETSKIRLENYKSVLKLQKMQDSMQVAHLRFQKNSEIQSYIEQNETLKDLLSKQGFKKPNDYSKLNEMILATQKYLDSTISSFKANELVKNIQENKNGIVEFSKTGKCISYDGSLEYNDGDLIVNTFNEKYNGNILLTNSKGKRTKKFLFFRYGPRENKYTTTTDCGDVNVQVIERVK